MIAFARACDNVAATAAKLAKIERLATYFGTLDGADLRAVAQVELKLRASNLDENLA